MNPALDELRGLVFAAEALPQGSSQQSHRALQVRLGYAVHWG
jgi:hypothetical protein